MVHADSEFEPLQDPLATAGSSLHVCSNDEYVPEVECFILTFKEQMHCLYHSVPFKHFSAVMLQELIMASMLWLNMFPPHDGVSDTLSPHALLTGFNLNYNKHCHPQFSAYVQTHEEHDNSMQSHTTGGAIALCPTGNQQGGYYFMSLTSGHRLIQNCWIPPPPQM